jgi:hypothetical protein
MPGFIKDKDSLATGIPNRTIGPETGSFGNAVMTNTGDTGEGTNQDHESSPPPAAGIGGSAREASDLGEPRNFEVGEAGSEAVDFPEDDIEPVYQQIADGGDHFDHKKRLHADEADEDDLDDGAIENAP